MPKEIKGKAMITECLMPLEQSIDTDRSLFSILEERAGRTPDRSLIEYKDPDTGEWRSFTAVEFRDKVVAFAKGLIARGVMPGDAVSVISKTRWEWTALDMAIMSIGALTVSVYETNSPAQVSMTFNDSHVRMAFAENDMQRDKVESVRAMPGSRRRVRHRLRRARYDRGVRQGRHRRGVPRTRAGSPRRRPRHHRVYVRFHRHAEGHRAEPRQLHLHHLFRRALDARHRHARIRASVAVPAARMCSRATCSSSASPATSRSDCPGTSRRFSPISPRSSRRSSSRCPASSRRSTTPPREGEFQSQRPRVRRSDLHGASMVEGAAVRRTHPVPAEPPARALWQARLPVDSRRVRRTRRIRGIGRCPARRVHRAFLQWHWTAPARRLRHDRTVCARHREPGLRIPDRCDRTSHAGHGRGHRR